MTDINRAITKQIAALLKERRAIDDKIAALELAYETLTGAKITRDATGVPGPAPADEETVAKKKVRAHGLDRQSVPKTRAYLQEQGRNWTSAKKLRKHFGITLSAAIQRGYKLVKLGEAELEGRGEAVKFRMLTKAAMAKAEVAEETKP